MRWFRKAEAPAPLRCSFCGKSQHEVSKLIAGPATHICDECVAICNRILVADRSLEEPVAAAADAAQSEPRCLEATIRPLCRLPVALEHGMLVPDRGVLCLPCAEAIALDRAESDGGAR